MRTQADASPAWLDGVPACTWGSGQIVVLTRSHMSSAISSVYSTNNNVQTARRTHISCVPISKDTPGSRTTCRRMTLYEVVKVHLHIAGTRGVNTGCGF